jgi:hypothetical protein
MTPDLLKEARSLGCTLLRWKLQNATWRETHVSNGSTDAAKNLIMLVKRVVFSLKNSRNYRLPLFYAGTSNRSVLPLLTLRWPAKCNLVWYAGISCAATTESQ